VAVLGKAERVGVLRVLLGSKQPRGLSARSEPVKLLGDINVKSIVVTHGRGVELIVVARVEMWP
jgi:hypothetical protein